MIDLYCQVGAVVGRKLETAKWGMGVVPQSNDRWKAAQLAKDDAATEEAHTEMEMLNLFKGDVGSFGHALHVLPQIFDYGNTGLEKRATF